jgi:hypothetical protein
MSGARGQDKGWLLLAMAAMAKCGEGNRGTVDGGDQSMNGLRPKMAWQRKLEFYVIWNDVIGTQSP